MYSRYYTINITILSLYCIFGVVSSFVIKISNMSNIQEILDNSTTTTINKINDTIEFDLGTDDMLDDIILPKGMLSDSVESSETEETVVLKWPEKDGFPTIYYKIHDMVNETKKNEILEAIEYVKKSTCVKFKDTSTIDYEPSGFVWFFSNGTGCMAHVGYREDLPEGQIIELHDSCHTGNIIHEITHTLGLLHVQMRSDRDSYIYLIKENLDAVNHMQFVKVSHLDRATAGTPYDFTSIMHYYPTAFSVNNKMSMIAKDPRLQFLMGINMDVYTFYDKYIINRYYECTNKWEKSCNYSKVCKNDGYILENCTCECPPGTSGELCEDIIPSPFPHYYADFIPKDCYQQINSPGKVLEPPMVGDYIKSFTVCAYDIEAPEYHKIKISFSKFRLYESSHSEFVDEKCFYDRLVIMTGGTTYSVYCGQKLEGREVTVENNKVHMYLKIRTFFSSYLESSVSQGFTAKVSFQKMSPQEMKIFKELHNASAQQSMPFIVNSLLYFVLVYIIAV